MNKFKISSIIIALVVLAGVLVLDKFHLARRLVQLTEPTWGMTFSLSHADYLTGDWRAAYLALLDDMGVRYFRIPVNWNIIEPEADQFNFDDFDWLLQEADKREAKVILTIGRKLPRWPECHIPDWAFDLSRSEQEARTMNMLEQVVDHFKNSPAVDKWQVENEALFKFGECPYRSSLAFLKKEIALVQSLDDRPILTTDSGELSLWLRTSRAGVDLLGTSLYRITGNPWYGDFIYPLGPEHYQRKAWLVKSWIDQVIITELQVEPWATESLLTMPLERQLELMPLPRVREQINFARQTNFVEAYLWGGEWFYWLKQQGQSQYWDEAKKLFTD